MQKKNRTRLHILLAAARRHDQLSTIAACLARRCWAENRCNEHNFLCANTNKPSTDHWQTRERARIKIAGGGGCGFLFANLWAGAAPTLFSVRKMLKFWPPLVVARAGRPQKERRDFPESYCTKRGGSDAAKRVGKLGMDFNIYEKLKRSRKKTTTVFSS